MMSEDWLELDRVSERKRMEGEVERRREERCRIVVSLPQQFQLIILIADGGTA